MVDRCLGKTKGKRKSGKEESRKKLRHEAEIEINLWKGS